MMILRLGNQSLEVDKNFELYNTARTMFIKHAVNQAERFVKQYKQCSDLDSAFNLYMEAFSGAVEKAVDMSCRFLFNMGVLDVSEVDFAERYYDKYLCVDDILEPITVKLEEIASVADDLELRRQLKKLDRGYWQGGGFGLRGAVTGAINAAIMNTAYGAIYAMGDYFRSCNNKSKVEKLKKQLFQDSDVLSAFYYAISQACQNCFYGLYEELLSHDLITPVTFDVDYATRINTNATKYAKDKEQKRELVIQSILTFPYDESLYNALYKEFPDTEGLNEFAAFFGVNIIREAYDRFDVLTKLKSIKQLKGENYRQVTLAADMYIALAKQYNIDITNEMQELSKQYVSLCPTMEVIDEAIEFLTKHYSQNVKIEDPKVIAPIIDALKNRKRSLYAAAENKRLQEEMRRKEQEKKRQEEELARLKRRKFDDRIDVIRGIKAIIEYSDKYNVAIGSVLCTYLLRLNEKCYTVDNVEYVISHLNELKCSRYPQIERIISAYQIKKKVIEWDRAIGLSSFYVCSPVIVDLVENARSGNPIAQQWLVELLFQDNFIDTIRSSWLVGNSETKKDTSMIMDFVSDIVMYLFDKPEKYSFDLFMRIKTSYPFIENIEEYIESLEPFNNNEACLAGSYEYGKMLCESKNQKIGLPALQAAARGGYDRAAKYLHTYYSKLDDSSFETVYFATLQPNSYFPNNICNYNPNREDEQIITTLRVLHDLLTGNLFLSDSVDDMSKKLREILLSLKTPYEEWSIGYCGDFADKFVLKTAKLALSVPNSEKAILSYSYKSLDDTYMFVITDKHLYCGKDRNIRKVAFENSFAAPRAGIFDDFRGNYHPLYHVYVIAHYYYKKYTENTPTAILEKMAMVGHPLAVCNLLSNSDICEDKKAVLLNQKNNWEKRGKYYAVCPQCHKTRARDDTFCPDCGARI